MEQSDDTGKLHAVKAARAVWGRGVEKVSRQRGNSSASYPTLRQPSIFNEEWEIFTSPRPKPGKTCASRMTAGSPIITINPDFSASASRRQPAFSSRSAGVGSWKGLGASAAGSHLLLHALPTA